MERKRSVIGRIILFCCIMLFGAVSVKAEGKSNVFLQLSESDVKMTLYQVAEVEEDQLYYTEAFADCDVELENLSQAEAQDAADALAAYAKNQKLKGTVKKTDSEGNVSFTNLADGVYLLTQTGSQDVIAVQNMLFVVPQGTGDQKNYNVVLEAKSSFPEGYMLLEDPVPFEIEKAGQVAVVDGIYQTDSGEVEELDVVNAPDFPDGPLYDMTPTPSVTMTVTPSVTPTDGSDTPGNNTPGNPGNSTPGIGTPGVKTGDNSPILSLVILLVLAAAVITVSLRIRKKHNEN